MNCARCDYLLWDLPENRCPECGLEFDPRDYAFDSASVHFVCRDCGQSYLGGDPRGHPYPSRFECVSCHQPLDVSRMSVRPIREDATGSPLRFGTPWQFRRRGGFVRGFVDAVARLAIAPGEYFRLVAVARQDGALGFSILCAYLGWAVFLGVLWLFHSSGLGGWLPDPAVLLKPVVLVIVLAAIPVIQVAWNYAYGVLIQITLSGLGSSHRELESSIRAVSLGAAVLPAILLLPPVGLLWYVFVVGCGIEQLHETSRLRAMAATIVPMLVAGNALLFAWYYFA